MTAVRPEWLGPDNDNPQTTEQEAFVPQRYRPQKLGDVDQLAAKTLEGEIRDTIRRDVAVLRRRRDDVEPAGDSDLGNLDSLIGRACRPSMEEIDRVILELQGVRHMLRSEGERVSREVAGYASLSHVAMSAMQVIGDNLRQWKQATEVHVRHGGRQTG
jgi:hypothetical protein